MHNTKVRQILANTMYISLPQLRAIQMSEHQFLEFSTMAHLARNSEIESIHGEGPQVEEH